MQHAASNRHVRVCSFLLACVRRSGSWHGLLVNSPSAFAEEDEPVRWRFLDKSADTCLRGPTDFRY
jgi:hypothetical protein